MIIAGAVVLTGIRYGVIGMFNILASTDVFTVDAVTTTIDIVRAIFM